MARGRKDYEKVVIAVESEGYKDLHGRILMNDDFEDSPLKWGTGGTGTWFVSRQARAAYNGSYGTELDVTSDAPPAARHARMYRYAPIDVTLRMNFELFWRANVIARMNRLQIGFAYFSGNTLYNAILVYEPPLAQWRYRPLAGPAVTLPGSTQTFQDEAWNELMLSANFATGNYIRMKSNNMEINMGSMPCYQFPDATGAHVVIWIEVENITANQLLVSTDDTVLKELET